LNDTLGSKSNSFLRLKILFHFFFISFCFICHQDILVSSNIADTYLPLANQFSTLS
jgi:hypothetical protein